MIIVIPKN